jgi:hypothetical protein
VPFSSLLVAVFHFSGIKQQDSVIRQHAKNQAARSQTGLINTVKGAGATSRIFGDAKVKAGVIYVCKKALRGKRPTSKSRNCTGAAHQSKILR